MAANDFAIIVGLQHYPGLDHAQAPLSGAENDAIAFRDWVISPVGAEVPTENVTCIISSDYPITGNVLDAKPAFVDINKAFQVLRSKSTQKARLGEDPEIGRRLYIFMSGHGIAPIPYGNMTEKEAGLLMSDVDPTNIAAPTYHIPGTYAANWFCRNECFKEVFLFMDCCRDIQIVPALHIFLPPTGTANHATRFYAFATEWSRSARETQVAGKSMGIFTRTLMMALEGGAAVPVNGIFHHGEITGASLKGYLFNNMKKLINPKFLPNPKIDTPDVDYFPRKLNGEDIIIAKNVRLNKFPVKVEIPSRASGNATIMYNGINQVAQFPIGAARTLEFSLPRGMYTITAIVDGSVVIRLFDVTGFEDAVNPGQVIL